MNNAYIVTLMYFSSIEVPGFRWNYEQEVHFNTPKPLPCKWLTQYLPWWQSVCVVL